MTPYFDDGQITIYHGDCLDVLAPPTDIHATAVITDPPFGIDFDYGEDGHDDSRESYAEMMRVWIAHATRIVGDGPFWVWQAVPTACHWHEWFPADFRIFAACKGFVQFRPQPIQHSWDPVVFWGKLHGEPSVYRKDWHLQSKAPFGAHRPRIDHPCPRPLEQVRAVVEIATTPDDIILDPFVGSGTTLRAAMDCGRRAIGIEKSERHCATAVKRLQQSVMNLDVA